MSRVTQGWGWSLDATVRPHPKPHPWPAWPRLGLLREAWICACHRRRSEQPFWAACDLLQALFILSLSSSPPPSSLPQVQPSLIRFLPIKREQKVDRPPPYLAPQAASSKTGEQDSQSDLQALHEQKSSLICSSFQLYCTSAMDDSTRGV